MRTLKPVLILLPVLLSAATAGAEVTDSAPNGFTSVNTVTVTTADPQKAYEAVVLDWKLWWDPSHSWFGDAKNFKMDASVGGGWFEVHPDGRWVKHLEVVFVDPGRQLRLKGGLGPLQGMAVTGTLTWEFKPADQGTEIVLTYAVGGYAPGGVDSLATAVDGVLAAQLDRLRGHLQP